MVYIPKGKDIWTRYGCKCKNKYKWKGKWYNNTCTAVDNSDVPWCMTVKCGVMESKGPNKGYWDNCVPDDVSFGDRKITYGKNYFLYNFIGIALFYIIFVFAIPFFLYTRKYNEILEVYLPNFDLLATAVSFGGGPTWRRAVTELYNPASKNLVGFISTLMINYMALMGVVYLVAMHTKRSRSIATGLGVGAVMVFLTYLLPNQIIAAIQLRVASWLRTILGTTKKRDGFDIYIPMLLVGLGVAALFIGAEKAILARHKTFIDPITKQIVKLAQGRF